MATRRPILGILSGISPVSGADYYTQISLRYGKHLGKGHLMPPNPLLAMVSVDCDEYASMLVASNWDGVRAHLVVGVEKLVACGIDFLCIASNTGHLAMPLIASRFPDLPVLHIADCTARAIKAHACFAPAPRVADGSGGGGGGGGGGDGGGGGGNDAGGSKRVVGLLGTEPTMREDYLKDRLAAHGIQTIVPDEEADLKQIFQFIMDELGFNVFKDTTRAFFVEQVRKLAARGAVAVILGCTEIELLELQEHVDVPLFRSAELHIEAASRVCAGLDQIEEYQPPGAAAAAAAAAACGGGSGEMDGKGQA